MYNSFSYKNIRSCEMIFKRDKKNTSINKIKIGTMTLALIFVSAISIKAGALEAKSPDEKKQIEESKYPQDFKFGDETRVYNEFGELFAVPAIGEITSPFGWRESPVDGNTKFHFGVDIAAKADTDVCAVKSGRVIFISEDDPVYGMYCKIQHDDGSVSMYAHLMSLEVEEGEYLTKGKRIGGMGTSGASTGVHLHFELVIGGENVDPLAYIFQSYNMKQAKLADANSKQN